MEGGGGQGGDGGGGLGLGLGGGGCGGSGGSGGDGGGGGGNGMVRIAAALLPVVSTELRTDVTPTTPTTTRPTASAGKRKPRRPPSPMLLEFGLPVTTSLAQLSPVVWTACGLIRGSFCRLLNVSSLARTGRGAPPPVPTGMRTQNFLFFNTCYHQCTK